MPERLTEAEVAAIREQYSYMERVSRVSPAGPSKTVIMIGRLLATLEAERARADEAVAFRRKLHMVGGWLYATLLMVSAQFGVHQEPKNAEPLAAWRALTRGGDDERA